MCIYSVCPYRDTMGDVYIATPDLLTAHSSLPSQLESEIDLQVWSRLQADSACMHTGRRFQSESTLRDIEIGEISRISMSR